MGKNYSSARQRENRQIQLILNKKWKILWKSNFLQIQTQEFYKEAILINMIFSDDYLKSENEVFRGYLRICHSKG